jgi:hypothetical protein
MVAAAPPGRIGARRARGRGWLGAAATFGCVGLSSPLRAAGSDCATAAAYSPCFDADARWLAPSQSPFVGIPGAVPPPARSHTVGAAFGWVERPVSLTLPGPDPAGRPIAVVDRLLTLTLLGTTAVNRWAAVDLALPLTLAQRGAGMEAVTSLGSPPTPRVLRDPRLGLTFALGRWGRANFAALATRTVFVAPFGDERTLGGGRGFASAPSLLWAARLHRLQLAAEAGARLRSPVTVGDVRLGTAFTGSVGASLDLLRPDRLTLQLEATASPVLVPPPAAAGLHAGSRPVPAEWLATVVTRPWGSEGPSLGVSGGSAIPWPSRGEADTTFHASVTAPRLRALLLIRLPLGLGAQASPPPARR